MVDLPLAMWAQPPLHKAYHDGWKAPFEEVIGVTPAASYAAFNTWAKNPSNPELFLRPRWYEELKLGDVLPPTSPPADDEENAASASGPTSWVAVVLAAVASLAVWNKK